MAKSTADLDYPIHQPLAWARSSCSLHSSILLHIMPSPNPNTQTITVQHLGGIEASYQMPKPYDAKKPTLVLVNSFTTDSELYKAQYDDKRLTDAMNLISIEPLGHGQTRCKSKNFTYWDTAIMNLQACFASWLHTESAHVARQVLEALGIKKAFALGTSQGGWLVTRMALLAPDVVRCSKPEKANERSD